MRLSIYQEKICMNQMYNKNQKVINENNELKATVRSYEAEIKDVKKNF